VLNSEALSILSRKQLQAGNEELPLFAGKTGKPRDTQNIYNWMKGQLPVRLKRITPYCLRHYFATQSDLRGWAAEDLMEYMGHADISTTMKYYVDRRAERIGPPPMIANASNA